MDRLDISARGIAASIDLAVGHIIGLTIESGGRGLKPLHRAPWIGERDVPEDLPEGVKRLSGDFFCAPFSRSDIEPAPLHGWPANSRWTVISSAPTPDGWRALLQLERRVLGAVIEKSLVLRDGHPFLYQEHVLTGGVGQLPVAHHPMTVMADGGRIAFSPKRLAMTPAEALEPDLRRGRSILAYPASTTDLGRFPKTDGSFLDLGEYPTGARNEDFVTLVEADHGGLAWTAVARRAEADVVLILKNARELPVTMLWYSNGGRDYAPWNGRHAGVLGIEDGRTAMGHSASVKDNPLRCEGVATAFQLGGRISIRHVIGADISPEPGTPPAAVTSGNGALLLARADGSLRRLDFDAEFLAERQSPR